ncbi:uncharacterized protein [Rutidosis leptorrhynchoides]|uniref:uncharacterized protein n=1 Tax=Rutidosis leptorrhynchoides TaxID=125765 RepID=UPI003A9A1588
MHQLPENLQSVQILPIHNVHQNLPTHDVQQNLPTNEESTNLQTPNLEEARPEVPPPNTEEFDFFNYGVENVCKIKKTDHPFESVVASSASEEENDREDQDEDENEEEEEKKDVFWNMPLLLSEHDQETESTSQITTSYRVSDLIKVRQTFLNKDDFVNHLYTKCLEENFQIKPVKSDKSRFTAKCMLPNCEWKCSAYKIRHTDNFIVKKLHDVHTCSRTQIMGNNKHASKKVLGSILMESFKAANRDYNPKDIRDDVGNRFRVSISYNQAWRAKCHAIEMLRGSMDDSFRMLPIYLHNIKIHNPGSMTNVVTDNENRFVMCYMSFGAVIRSFVQNVRPIIIVDGAHLKAGYLGTNLVAVAMDANNGILPLAYGIGEGETNEVWSWFFGNLRDHLESCVSVSCLNMCHKLTYIETQERKKNLAYVIKHTQIRKQ